MGFSNEIEELLNLVKRVEENPLLFEDTSKEFEDKLSGMSGLKFRILISEIAAQMPKGLVYLEVGIFQGLTPLTVARRNPDTRVVGVDDFSQFDRDGSNLARIHSAIEALDISNFKFFNDDFEHFFSSDPADLQGKIGIYFFDASHDYRSQILALMHAPSWLATGGIIVVDDCNYPHVRQATVDFLRTHPDYKLLCEFYTGKHPNYWSQSRPSRLDRFVRRIFPNWRYQEPDHEHMRFCKETWWNGVNIIIHDPLDTLMPIFPDVPNGLREKFVSQHGFAGCSAEGTISRLAAKR